MFILFERMTKRYYVWVICLSNLLSKPLPKQRIHAMLRYTSYVLTVVASMLIYTSHAAVGMFLHFQRNIWLYIYSIYICVIVAN